MGQEVVYQIRLLQHEEVVGFLDFYLKRYNGYFGELLRQCTWWSTSFLWWLIDICFRMYTFARLTEISQENVDFVNKNYIQFPPSDRKNDLLVELQTHLINLDEWLGLYFASSDVFYFSIKMARLVSLCKCSTTSWKDWLQGCWML